MFSICDSFIYFKANVSHVDACMGGGVIVPPPLDDLGGWRAGIKKGIYGKKAQLQKNITIQIQIFFLCIAIYQNAKR